MNHGPLRQLIRSLRDAAGPPGIPADDDTHLLRRFVACADRSAFELLLWRHGPTVLGVCRRLLRDEHDAADAFQATFLTLVKKAGSIASGAALGGWLYRVAYRVALRLRAAQARRALRERSGVEELPALPTADPPGDDLRAVLDEEINRLPARHRAAFVLCCLEGKTGAEAARELGLPAGTVSSRVTRARALLRRRLANRGVVPSAGVFAVLAGEGLTASVSAPLVHTTLEAARLFAAGTQAGGALSEQAITLMEGVLRAMSMTRLKIMTLVLLVLGALVGGAVVTRPALEAAPAAEARQKAITQPAPQPKDGKPGPVAVEVVRPQPGGVKRTVTQPAAVQAFNRADIFNHVPGVLKTLKVDLGDRVKRGQVLAEIDAPLLTLEEKQAVAACETAKGKVREADARLAAAKAEAVVARGGVDQKTAELKSARAQLSFQKDAYERMKKLADARAVAATSVQEKAQQFKSARAKADAETVALENAKAEVAVKQIRITQAEAARETAITNVKSAEIGLEKARVLSGFTQIRAPLDGVVIERNYSVGDYLRANEQGGQPALLRIYGMSRMRIIVQIPGRDAPLVEPGIPAEVTIDALPDIRIPCKVSRIGVALDPKTRTMQAELDVPNPKGLLRPGMYGAADVQLKVKTGAVRIPISAVRWIDLAGTKGVYVVRNGKAHLTRVVTGDTDDDNTETEILSGLRPTDLVVLNPDRHWGETVPVTIKKNRKAK